MTPVNVVSEKSCVLVGVEVGEIDGVKVIDGPNGRWPEGHEAHPWEQKAIQAEKE